MCVVFRSWCIVISVTCFDVFLLVVGFRYWLFVGCCVLHAMCCEVLRVCCLLLVACCVLRVVCVCFVLWWTVV